MIQITLGQITRPLHHDRNFEFESGMSLILRITFCLLLWGILVEGRPGALLGGVAAVAAALAVAASMPPAHRYRIRLRAIPRFAAHFLVQSVLAGIDVARRILHPSLPLNPGYIHVRTRVGPGAPRWLLSSTLSLMPGTLGVHIEGDSLRVHCLDVERPVRRDIRRTERCVAALFDRGARA